MSNPRQFLTRLVPFLVLILFSVAASGQTLDLSFDQVDYAEIYWAIGVSQGLNVLVDPSVAGQGTFELKGVSFQEALDLISRHSGYAHYLSDKTLLVATAQRLGELEDKQLRYLPLSSLSAEEVKQALNLMLPQIQFYVHPQGGLVVLQGSQSQNLQAEELLLTLDGVTASETKESPLPSLLEIFQGISAEMGLNLVADPTLQAQHLYLDLRQKSPAQLIEEIQELVPLKVTVTAHSLVVGQRADDSDSERVKVYRLDYAEPEETQSALSAFVPEEHLRLDRERKSIIVRGTDSELAEVELFLAEFDQPLPQVALELWVQEMSTEALRNLGIEWRGLPSFSRGDAPIFLELEWEPWELILALRILEDQGDARLLANPRITTLSGESAHIFVGDRVPVVLKDDEGIQRVEFLESGINLTVTPRISADDYITILVQPEVSTFIWKTDSEYPQIRTREAETSVRVKDGQPIVLGGLLQEQENELISRIPFLSQLPVLGKLFQWKETKKTQTEMTIFLIPRIIRGERGVVDQGFFTVPQ